VYVTDEFQIGLHAEKALNSPIVSVVAAGTPLELVKREEILSYVRDLSGIGGWIDNSYLSENTLASEQLQAALAKVATLEQTLENLGGNDEKLDTPTISQEQLLQLEALLDEERNKAESLQKQVVEMEGQLSSSNSDSLYKKIEQLSSENTKLNDQLSTLLESPTPGTIQLQAGSPSEEASGAGRYILTLLIAAIVGLGLGVYIMDLSNRRRHGGFRV
jgi:SH3 domain protein